VPQNVHLFVHRDADRFRLQMPPDVWRMLKSACLSDSAESCFDGGRNAFELDQLPPDGWPSRLLSIRLESWSGEQRMLRFVVAE
jgi:hypothetical protein